MYVYDTKDDITYTTYKDDIQQRYKHDRLFHTDGRGAADIVYVLDFLLFFGGGGPRGYEKNRTKKGRTRRADGK